MMIYKIDRDFLIFIPRIMCVYVVGGVRVIFLKNIDIYTYMI